MFRYKRAQSVMEGVILLSIVTLAVVTMFPRVKRITQRLIKATADQVGLQRNAEQNIEDGSGYMNAMFSETTSSQSTIERDRLDVYDRAYDDHSNTYTRTVTHQGSKKEE